MTHVNGEGRLQRPRLRFERDFTQLPNTWLRDERISFRARGLRDYLMSHEAGFHVTIKALAANGPEGREAIQTAVRELEQAGYLERIQTRGRGGRLGHVWWDLKDPFELPESLTQPLTGFPSTAQPSPVQPLTGNPPTKEEQLKEHLSPELKFPATDARADEEADPSSVYSQAIRLKCPRSRSGRHTFEGSGFCRDCAARDTDVLRPELVSA